MYARARWISFVLFLCALTAPLAAQSKVTVEAVLVPATAKPGDEVELVLTAKVEAGYHAYGSKETTNLPVKLKAKNLQLGGLERVGEAVVPGGMKKTVFGVDTYPLPSTFKVTQKLKVPAGFAGTEASIEGALDYQVCDENMCLAPSKEPFAVKLAITGGASAAPAAVKPYTPGDVVSATPPAPIAQDPKPEVKPGLQLLPDEKFAVRATIEPATARPGETVTLVLDALVDARYHAYGTKETTNLPVELKDEKLQLGGLESGGDAVVPPGEPAKQFGVETFPLPHEFRVTKRLKVPAATKPGALTVKGELDYQLCDDNQCLPPGAIEFSAAVTIEAGAARAATEPAPSASAPDDQLGGSLWALLLACIGGGLFALVMPCTYPMIPITFSFFTKQADLRGGKVMTLALTYGAGIVGMFAAIGALAGVLGGYIVPFAAHWITNTVIGTAFVVFALSLLGVITLQPPQFLVSAAGKSRGVGGGLGVLLMGATLVVTSFTCTAPVVALLLVPAVQSGDGLRPTLGMAMFGLTMALPFVFLALLPGRVRALPRSGEWMNTLKVTLGFIELAAALKFFSNAEYVEELHVLPRETFFGIWIAIFVALAGYLWGLLPRRAVGNGRRVGGLASLAFAGYCVYGLVGGKLDFVMNALAPAYGLRDVSQHELVVDDYEAAAAKAKAQGKLVLVNLTGFTCANCRMVERGILPDAAIAPTLAQHFVEARLHMDNESAIPAAKWARHLKLRHDLVNDRVTTPTYVTVDPNVGAPIVEHVLRGGPGAWLVGYQAFLEQTLAKTGRTAKK